MISKRAFEHRCQDAGLLGLEWHTIALEKITNKGAGPILQAYVANTKANRQNDRTRHKNMTTNVHNHHQNTQTPAQILPERLIKHMVLTLHSHTFQESNLTFSVPAICRVSMSLPKWVQILRRQPDNNSQDDCNDREERVT